MHSAGYLSAPAGTATLTEVVSEVDLGEVRIDLCRHLVMMA